MRVLATKQFNKAVRELDERDRERVLRLFDTLGTLSKDELIRARKITRIARSEEATYMIKSKDIRVYFTYDVSDGIDKLIMLDAMKRNSSRYKNTYRLARG